MGRISGGLSAAAITARLQQVANAASSPINADEVHEHVFNIWKTMREDVDKTKRSGQYKIDSDTFVRWSRQRRSRVVELYLDALRPDVFRESFRGLCVFHKPQRKDPGALMKLIQDQALRWLDIQVALDANGLAHRGHASGGREQWSVRNRCGGEVTSCRSNARWVQQEWSRVFRDFRALVWETERSYEYSDDVKHRA